MLNVNILRMSDKVGLYLLLIVLVVISMLETFHYFRGPFKEFVYREDKGHLFTQKPFIGIESDMTAGGKPDVSWIVSTLLPGSLMTFVATRLIRYAARYHSDALPMLKKQPRVETLEQAASALAGSTTVAFNFGANAVHVALAFALVPFMIVSIAPTGRGLFLTTGVSLLTLTMMSKEPVVAAGTPGAWLYWLMIFLNIIRTFTFSHTYITHRNRKRSECPCCVARKERNLSDDDELVYVFRREESYLPGAYSYLDLFSYCFYTPTLFGPIVGYRYFFYDKFYKHRTKVIDYLHRQSEGITRQFQLLTWYSLLWRAMKIVFQLTLYWSISQMRELYFPIVAYANFGNDVELNQALPNPPASCLFAISVMYAFDVVLHLAILYNYTKLVCLLVDDVELDGGPRIFAWHKLDITNVVTVIDSGLPMLIEEHLRAPINELLQGAAIGNTIVNAIVVVLVMAGLSVEQGWSNAVIHCCFGLLTVLTLENVFEEVGNYFNRTETVTEFVGERNMQRAMSFLRVPRAWMVLCSCIVLTAAGYDGGRDVASKLQLSFNAQAGLATYVLLSHME